MNFPSVPVTEFIIWLLSGQNKKKNIDSVDINFNGTSIITKCVGFVLRLITAMDDYFFTIIQ